MESPSKRTTILGKYQLTRFLGRGSFAKVYQARSMVDGATVAVKVIDKSKTVDAAMEPRIVGEIDAMRRLHLHPNILRIQEVMATKTKIYLVVDFAGGGELLSKISRRGGRFPEATARRYFQKLVSALCFCHRNGIAHRDLKPQNLLLDAAGNLKVSDFGLSALPEQLKNGLLHTACGTPAYTAPEILCRRQGGYDGAKADAWSCGVVLYVLLAGYLPFDDTNIPAMCRRIINRDYHFPSWVSRGARHVIYQLLDPIPETRLTLESLCQNNCWFKKSLDLKVDEQSDLYGTFACSDRPKLGINAFHIISMSSGLDLRGLFETERSWEKRFTSDKSLDVLEEKVKDVGVALGFRLVFGKNGAIGFGKGKVSLLFEVFQIVAHDDLLLVALKVLEGAFEFEQLHWPHWELRLKDFVLSWHHHDTLL